MFTNYTRQQCALNELNDVLKLNYYIDNALDSNDKLRIIDTIRNVENYFLNDWAFMALHKPLKIYGSIFDFINKVSLYELKCQLDTTRKHVLRAKLMHKLYERENFRY